MSGPFDDASDPGGNGFGYTGSRADAIADGRLYDVSEAAADAGFIWPLAITREAWNECVAWTDDDSAKQVFQSEPVRTAELLRVCAYTIRLADPTENRMNFEITRIPRDGKATVADRVTLQIAAHVGDEGRPALTIGLPPVIKHC